MIFWNIELQVSNWTKIFTVIASEAKQSQPLRLLHSTSFHSQRHCVINSVLLLSHHIFIKDETILVIPVHNNRVKSVYVKRVLELVEDDF